MLLELSTESVIGDDEWMLLSK